MTKNPPANVGDVGSTPGWEDPLEKGMAPLFSLGESQGQRQPIVHGVTKSWTLLSN